MAGDDDEPIRGQMDVWDVLEHMGIDDRRAGCCGVPEGAKHRAGCPAMKAVQDQCPHRRIRHYARGGQQCLDCLLVLKRPDEKSRPMTVAEVVANRLKEKR
jgi:hypothetical protein